MFPRAVRGASHWRGVECKVWGYWGIRSHAAVPRVAGKESTESVTMAVFGCFTLVIVPSDRIAVERHWR